MVREHGTPCKDFVTDFGLFHCSCLTSTVSSAALALQSTTTCLRINASRRSNDAQLQQTSVQFTWRPTRHRLRTTNHRHEHRGTPCRPLCTPNTHLPWDHSNCRPPPLSRHHYRRRRRKYQHVNTTSTATIAILRVGVAVIVAATNVRDTFPFSSSSPHDRPLYAQLQLELSINKAKALPT